MSRIEGHLSRRRFVQGAGVAGLGLLAACGRLPWQSQGPARVPRVGWLSPGFSTPSGLSLSGPDPLHAFREGLQQFGYVEGQNILIEVRYGEEDRELFAARAAELARLPVDVIVAFSAPAPFAARQATHTIPIVMLGGPPDPVGYGFIESYARPDGNVTGLTALPSGAIGGKYLELLKEAAPGLSRVARLFDLGSGGFAGSSAERTGDSAAQSLGLQVQILEVRGPGEIEGALEAAAREGAEALTVTGTPLFIAHARRIAEVALQHGWATIAPWRPFAEAGFLMAYGAGALPTIARRAARYVDKILKGTSPADIPVEQPREFDFIINLKTAEALGLTIPPHVLLQATEIIR